MKKRDQQPLGNLCAGNLGVDPAAETPDAMELAAWFDGRLAAAQSERVEAQLVANTALRQALLHANRAEPSPLTAWECVRAQALVTPAAVPTAIPRWRYWLDKLLQPVPVWAMAIVLALCGFYLGSGLGAAPHQREAQLLAQILGGLPSL